MKGFANVISFRKISDEDVTDVEEFIRTELLEILTTDANNSFGGDCDAIIDHEILVQHFGSRFASDTSNFKFERGDRIFINELVLHVKTVAEGAGINQFRMKRKKLRQHTKMAPKKVALECAATNGENINKLEASLEAEHATNNENQLTVKTQLIEKVKGCLESFKIEADDFEEEMVHVCFDDGKTNGSIQCVVCEKNGVKSKPYRVYYCESPDSNFWVLSNFKKHLEKTHHLVAVKTVANKDANRRKKIAANGKKSKADKTTKNSGGAEDSNSTASEVVLVHSPNNSSIIEAADDVILVVEDNKDGENEIAHRLLDQISSQMTKMVTATLNNAEELESMEIVIREEAR